MRAAIDAVHCSETNKDYILELNECSIGDVIR